MRPVPLPHPDQRVELAVLAERVDVVGQARHHRAVETLANRHDPLRRFGHSRDLAGDAARLQVGDQGVAGHAPEREVQRGATVGGELPERNAAPFADVRQVQIAEDEAGDAGHEFTGRPDPVDVRLAGVQRNAEQGEAQVRGLADHQIDADLLVRHVAGAHVEGGQQHDRAERLAVERAQGEKAVLAAAPEEHVDGCVGRGIGG